MNCIMIARPQKGSGLGAWEDAVACQVCSINSRKILSSPKQTKESLFSWEPGESFTPFWKLIQLSNKRLHYFKLEFMQSLPPKLGHIKAAYAVEGNCFWEPLAMCTRLRPEPGPGHGRPPPLVISQCCCGPCYRCPAVLFIMWPECVGLTNCLRPKGRLLVILRASMLSQWPGIGFNA